MNTLTIKDKWGNDCLVFVDKIIAIYYTGEGTTKIVCTDNVIIEVKPTINEINIALSKFKP
jgi:hypothetical protein